MPAVRNSIGARVKRFFLSPAVVAWAAVLISLMQLLLSVPLLTNFYLGSDLHVSKMVWEIAGPSAADFSIYNRGRGTAKDVEIGLLLHPNGYVQLLPDVAHRFECEDKTAVLRSCRLSISRVRPGEGIRIAIFRGKKADPEVEGLLKILVSIGMAVPRLEYVYSDDGVIKSSFDIQKRPDITGEVVR